MTSVTLYIDDTAVVRTTREGKAVLADKKLNHTVWEPSEIDGNPDGFVDAVWRTYSSHTAPQVELYRAVL